MVCPLFQKNPHEMEKKLVWEGKRHCSYIRYWSTGATVSLLVVNHKCGGPLLLTFEICSSEQYVTARNHVTLGLSRNIGVHGYVKSLSYSAYLVLPWQKMLTTEITKRFCYHK